MSENEEILSKKVLMLIGVIFLIILIVGLILLILGFNEAFYVEDLAVQSFFLIITELGSEIAYILILAVIYFIYDKKLAKNLGFMVLSSSLLNFYIKELMQDPRPPSNAVHKEEGYGFPSGHSQMSVDFYGYLAYRFKDKTEPSFIIPIILSGLISLIAISRIIIGVHDLQDIIGGLLIGIGFLILFLYVEPILSEKIGGFNLIMKLILSVLIPVIILVLLVVFLPQGEDFAMLGGMILGFSVGYVMEGEYIKYDPSDIDNKHKLINLIIGIVLLLVSFILLDILIEGSIILEFIKYATLAFIITFVIPLIFTKINPK